VPFNPLKPPKHVPAQGLGQGAEIALTLLVFVGLGALVDRWLGTFPLVTVIATIVAGVGQLVRSWYDYDGRMRVLEEERRQRERGRVA
jgi:F0F1-type ATP synthase assembly protein I